MSSPFNVNPEYDIVIAGGGASACVVAGRLATADPNLRILLLESGPPTRELLKHVQPARYLSHLLPTADTVRHHAATPSAAVGGRSLIVTCGQCAGGGSSVNFAMYTRASASDYNDWEKVYNNPGWGSQDLIPLLEKSETYQPKDLPLHGHSGPLNVSYGGIYTNVGESFLSLAKTMDKRRDGGDDVDPNDLSTVNKYSRWPKWIDEKTGRRSDAVHSFIYNIIDNNPNLQLITGAQVLRVTFEGDHASGVQFRWNPRFHSHADRTIHSVRAVYLVLLSAGTFGSPGILERSGIGRKEVLNRVNVPLKVELDGVGENYQDHNLSLNAYNASEDAQTLDSIVRSDAATISASSASEEWHKTGKGLIAQNGVEAGVKMRPFEDELPAFGPKFKKVWNSFYAPAPDKPLLWLGQASLLMSPDPAGPAGKFFMLGCYSEYPISRGHIHITDNEDPDAQLDFKSGMLEAVEDVAPLIWGYKYTREIGRRMPYFRGEFFPTHAPFAESSGARVLATAEGPLPLDAPKIQYTEEDDLIIEKFIREQVSTTWHSLGTCAMKPLEDGGVVDSHLNVYGVKALKIADMSIAPGNVGANTYSTAVTIGEKAALIIAAELGIEGV